MESPFFDAVGPSFYFVAPLAKGFPDFRHRNRTLVTSPLASSLTSSTRRSNSIQSPSKNVKNNAATFGVVIVVSGVHQGVTIPSTEHLALSF